MKRVLLLLGMIFSTTFVMASDNVLQTIEISPVKDTYNIVLVSDKSVDVKKEVQAPNKITLTMKDIRASKTLNTVYNNVSNVDTVMVEPQGNGVKIFFQAENAADSTITFDSLVEPAPILPNKSSTKLRLNNPIESYAPIYNEDTQSQRTSTLFNKLKSSQAIDGIRDSIDEDATVDAAHKFFSFGLIAVLAVAILRLFKRREPNMKIGLSQSLNDREVNMYQGAAPIGQTIGGMEKPFTTVNYGLNAYKNGNKNPYESTPMQFHNPRMRSFMQQQVPQSTMTMNAPQSSIASATAVQPEVKKMTTPVNTAPVNQTNPNVDNLKFLESMTAIYEKSGRHDLARGLKTSLSKNNLTK